MLTRLHVHTLTRSYAHTLTLIHAYTHTFIRSYVHTHIHTHVHAHTRTHTYTHTYTHTHTHTHTRTRARTHARTHAREHSHNCPTLGIIILLWGSHMYCWFDFTVILKSVDLCIQSNTLHTTLHDRRKKITINSSSAKLKNLTSVGSKK